MAAPVNPVLQHLSFRNEVAISNLLDRSAASDPVLNSGFDDEAGLPRGGNTPRAARISEVPQTSGSRGPKDHLRFGVTSAASRPARWTWRRDADDRQVFNVWALWVVAFYAVLAVALLAAMLLGAGG